MASITSPEFLKAATERALATFAQTMIGLLSVDGMDLTSVPWQAYLSAAGLATLLSYLKSIVANNVGPAGPSLANETIAGPIARRISGV